VPGEDYIRKIDALMMYHLHISNPEALSDEEWSLRHRQLLWVLEFEEKRFNLKKGERISI
jgi:hypothetical protein